MQLFASRNFQKQLDDLPSHEQQRILQALKTLRASLHDNHFPKGLGFKKMSADKYEIRVDLKIRIGFRREGDMFVAHLLGDHEDIRNFLKNY